MSALPPKATAKANVWLDLKMKLFGAVAAELNQSAGQTPDSCNCRESTLSP
jgi:hypothetical protein